MPWTRAVVENNLTMLTTHIPHFNFHDKYLGVFKVHFKTSSWVGKFSRFAGLLLLRPSPAKLGNSTPVL
jgi:hypothetical protein